MSDKASSESSSSKSCGVGRGRKILEKIQNLKDSSSKSSKEETVVSEASISSSSSQDFGSSGYHTAKLEKSTLTPSSESSESKSSCGRGALLAKYILNKRNSKDSGTSQETQIGRGSKGRGSLQNLFASSKNKSEEPEIGGALAISKELAKVKISTTTKEGSPVLKQGTSGTKFPASSNWIRILLDKDKAVFEYSVQFTPSVDSKNLRINLLNSQREKLGNVKSFDGSKLWLPIMLPQETIVLSAQSKHNDESFKLTITFIKKTSMIEAVQLYNVLFSRVLRVLKYVMVGKSYYSPGNSVLVPQHQLEIWPGYVTAAHEMESGVMLCVDMSHKVLRTNTVYQVLGDIAKCNKENFFNAAIRCIVGSVVLTRYNNKCYTVDDIAFDSNPMSSFKSSRGEETTYVDYYKNAYNIQIADTRQPLLLHKPRKKDLREQEQLQMICLIPELCYMTGLTDQMKTDFKVMKDLAQHTRLTPNARQACLRKFIRNVNDTPEAREILNAWGLTLFDDVIEMEGRIAPTETIIFGTRQIAGTANSDWSRESCREKVIRPIDLQPGMWLVIYANRDEGKANKFVEILRQVTNNMGIFVAEPRMIRLANDNTDSYVNSLRQNYHKELQLAVIIFPMPREDRYSAVKRLACAELGLPSQCINSRTISQDNKLRSVTQKIALQINCKLGGELWALKIPVSGLMVCGIDVYHDPIRKGNSVVGFVASINPTITRWNSQVLFQKPGDEIVHGLRNSLLKSIKKYYEEHHVLPQSIIVYRDGVSDGMLKVTRDHEIPQLTSIFQNFESYEPKFYFVVVQKRINTRIFASMSGRGMENPPPGSIIDHTITKRYWYDFFLVSQHVRQGTVSPTHYVVAYDSEGLKPEHMQRLTYKLTHLYYNWPGTVRVPAPCQYAHKLAYLIGQNVRKEPNHVIEDKLYFL